MSKARKSGFSLYLCSTSRPTIFPSPHDYSQNSQPIRQVLQKPDLVGRMVTWSVELSKFDIRYEPRVAIKAQALTDFLVEMMDEVESADLTWMLYIDGASSTKGCGVGVILEKVGDIMLEISVKFDFLVSNNQAEYEALIAGLQLASNVKVTRLTICSDS